MSRVSRLAIIHCYSRRYRGRCLRCDCSAPILCLSLSERDPRNPDISRIFRPTVLYYYVQREKSSRTDETRARARRHLGRLISFVAHARDGSRRGAFFFPQSRLDIRENFSSCATAAGASRRVASRETSSHVHAEHFSAVQTRGTLFIPLRVASEREMEREGGSSGRKINEVNASRSKVKAR